LTIEPEEIPASYSDGLRWLVKSMLNKNRENRPSAMEILNTPYVREYSKRLEKGELQPIELYYREDLDPEIVI
jgi:hypothetical protein